MGFSRHRHRRGGRRHTALRYSNGFTVVLPSIVTVAGYALAFFMLSQALRTVDLGIAYAVWAGIGTAAIALISMVVFGEPGTMGENVEDDRSGADHRRRGAGQPPGCPLTSRERQSVPSIANLSFRPKHTSYAGCRNFCRTYPRHPVCSTLLRSTFATLGLRAKRQDDFPSPAVRGERIVPRTATIPRNRD